MARDGMRTGRSGFIGISGVVAPSGSLVESIELEGLGPFVARSERDCELFSAERGFREKDGVVKGLGCLELRVVEARPQSGDRLAPCGHHPRVTLQSPKSLPSRPGSGGRRTPGDGGRAR